MVAYAIRPRPKLLAMAELDIDLLSKFRCMGTTDRDVLVEELHNLLSGQATREHCSFILEMSNWWVLMCESESLLLYVILKLSFLCPT